MRPRRVGAGCCAAEGDGAEALEAERVVGGYGRDRLGAEGFGGGQEVVAARELGAGRGGGLVGVIAFDLADGDVVNRSCKCCDWLNPYLS